MCFKKLPRKVRYPVKVHFARPLAAREATTDAIHDAWLDLSAAAFDLRLEKARAEMPGASARIVRNAVCLREAEWARPGETILCLAPEKDVIHETLAVYVRLRPLVRLVMKKEDVTGDFIAVGRARDFEAGTPEGARFAMCWDGVDARTPAGTLRGILDGGTGALLTLSVPDPAMPQGEEGLQPGSCEGGLGRVLTGAFTAAALRDFRSRHGLELTEAGFLMPANHPTAAT
jgi:acyl-[acyl-carrier-protein]-phospholipid O-acyltransferase/long-chain-fatty-acid--[acyl-carrier-protein] ligase